MSRNNCDYILTDYYIRMNIPSSSELSIIWLLIFETRDLNGALFLNVKSSSALSPLLVAAAKQEYLHFSHFNNTIFILAKVF